MVMPCVPKESRARATRLYRKLEVIADIQPNDMKTEQPWLGFLFIISPRDSRLFF